MAISRRILITGVTRGLGRALVDRLTERGHTVAGCGRSQAAVAELATLYPAPNRFDVVDVARWTDVQEWSASVLSDVGTPDLIINNAGVMNPCAPLWEITDEAFATTMRVNVDGTANVIRAFVPAMIEAGQGVIANMSSGWGRSTAPEVAPYCASKWAIEGLTSALAQELPAGLAAVAVNPGIIDTEMLRSCWGDGAGSFPEPDEWSRKAADFLLRLGTNDNGKSVSV